MEKKKYLVSVRVITHGPYGDRDNVRMLGETYAVSAAKAVNNVKYRLGIGKKKDSMYAPAVTEVYHATEI